MNDCGWLEMLLCSLTDCSGALDIEMPAGNVLGPPEMEMLGGSPFPGIEIFCGFPLEREMFDGPPEIEMPGRFLNLSDGLAADCSSVDLEIEIPGGSFLRGSGCPLPYTVLGSKSSSSLL